jgi:hypothetical protein
MHRKETVNTSNSNTYTLHCRNYINPALKAVNAKSTAKFYGLSNFDLESTDNKILFLRENYVRYQLYTATLHLMRLQTHDGSSDTHFNTLIIQLSPNHKLQTGLLLCKRTCVQFGNSSSFVLYCQN